MTSKVPGQTLRSVALKLLLILAVGPAYAGLYTIPESELGFYDQQVNLQASNPFTYQTDDFAFTLPAANDVSLEAEYFRKYGDGNTAFSFSLFDANMNQVGSTVAYGFNPGSVWEGVDYADLMAGKYTEQVQFEGVGLGFPAEYDFRFTASPTVNSIPEPRTISLVLVALACLPISWFRRRRDSSMLPADPHAARAAS